MRDFINFLKAPDEHYKLPKGKIRSVIGLFLLIYLLSILIVVGNNVLQSNLPESSLKNVPAVLPLWFALLVPPLLEELSFRLWLKRNTTTILISSVCFIWALVSTLMPYRIYSTDHLLLRCLIALAGGCAVTFLFKKQILNAKFPVLFYASAIVFGLMHAQNYYDIVNVWGVVYVVLIVITRILSGLFYGYVRIGYCFLAALIFHIAHNLPLIAHYLL